MSDEQPTLWDFPVVLDEDCPRGKVFMIEGKLHLHPDDYEGMASE